MVVNQQHINWCMAGSIEKKMIYAKIQIQVFVIFYVLILHHIINSKIRIKVPFRAMLFFNNLIDEIFSKICFKMNSFIWSFPRFDVLKVI